MLEHHRDAQLARFLRVADLDFLAVPDDVAFIGPHRAVDHLHQRGLAGAVLAEHGVDLAGLDPQADLVVRLDGGVLLADVDEFET